MIHKKWREKSSAILIGAIAAFIVIAPLPTISAPLTVPPITSLDGKHELSDIIVDNDWAVILGRAFFWDQQMGSDGGSCASCHFSAGADNRITAQINPGFTTVDPRMSTTEFGCTEGSECEVGSGKTASGGIMTPEYTVKPDDFPFRKLKDNDPNQVLMATNDVFSSSGSFDAPFIKSFPRNERCGEASAEIFYKTAKYKHGYSKKLAARMVEPKNTPTVINAVLQFRNFWDGRAANIFSGVGVHGMADINSPGTENNRLIVKEGKYPELTYLTLKNSSGASQAVGPILSNLEMSCDGRTFQDVARKVYYMRPLAKQRIAKTDSAFGIYGPKGDIRAKKKGLKGKYKYFKLIQLAFDEKWWKSRGLWKIEDGKLKRAKGYKHGFTQMEMNFPMFWGLAVQAYMATLISDQSRFDTAEALGCFNPTTFDPAVCTEEVWTKSEERGRAMFNGITFLPPGAGPNRTITGEPVNGANCAICHAGNATTDMAVPESGEFDALVSLVPGTFNDRGFHSTGTRPVLEDLQNGANDSFGNPMSYARQVFRNGGHNGVNHGANLCALGGTFAADNCENGQLKAGLDPATLVPPRIIADSMSKTSTIRNIALTPPYFSYGGYATLEQTIDFYARGGSTRKLPEGCTTVFGPPPPGVIPCVSDDSGTGPNGDMPIDQLMAELEADPNFNRGSNLGLMVPFPNTPENNKALVDFMKSFTDPRVQCDAGPFDHPELYIFNGHKGKDRNWDKRADDRIVRLPAVGMEGYSKASGLCLPNAGDLFAEDMGNRLKEKREEM